MIVQVPNLGDVMWLNDNLARADVVVLDASWYKPEYGRVGWIEYKESHIPGAGFFDIDEISDLDSDLPFMLPPEDEFSEAVGDLGIDNNTHVIVYDTHEEGTYSSARAWWMFRAMGYEKVSVLDGGFHKWKLDNLAVESGEVDVTEREFSARLRHELVCGLEDIKKASVDTGVQLIDARSPERFKGEIEEANPDLRAGHIPGSSNLFYETLFFDDATMKPADEIRTLFEAAGIDLEKPIITTCGSGITACILALALERIGVQDVPVYDASWAEWGLCSDCEIETV